MVIQLIVSFLNQLDENNFQQAIKNILILYVRGGIAEYFHVVSPTKACILQCQMREKSFYLDSGFMAAGDDAM